MTSFSPLENHSLFFLSSGLHILSGNSLIHTEEAQLLMCEKHFRNAV